MADGAFFRAYGRRLAHPHGGDPILACPAIDLESQVLLSPSGSFSLIGATSLSDDDFAASRLDGLRDDSEYRDCGYSCACDQNSLKHGSFLNFVCWFSAKSSPSELH